MNIRIYTKAAFPNGMAPTHRICEYGKALVNAGIETTVWVIHGTEAKHTQMLNSNQEGIYNGIKFRYAGSCYRAATFLQRRLADFKDLIISLNSILKLDNDTVVFLYLNSLLIESLFLAISKIKGIKVIRELCEYPYYEECRNASISLKYIFPHYDGFIAISHQLEELANNHKNKKALVTRIPILIDAESNLIDAESNDCSVKIMHDKPYIFHGGTMYERKDAIVSTMKAFAKACVALDKKIDYILAGPESPHKNELNKIINEAGIEDNIRFIGQVTPTEIVQWQNGASLVILNKNDNIQNRNGFSTKLGEVLLSETAVITTTVGEANYYLEDGVTAYITEPGKPDLIVNKIIEAFSDSKKRDIIARNGRRLALREFNSRTYSKRLKDFFKRIQQL